MPNVCDFRRVEIQFVAVVDGMKEAAPDHPQYGHAMAMKQVRHVAYHKPVVNLARLRIGWPKPGIEQVNESVFQCSRFLAHFRAQHLHVKFDRWFVVDDDLAKQHSLFMHT
jgi:hypothetical protein